MWRPGEWSAMRRQGKGCRWERILPSLCPSAVSEQCWCSYICIQVSSGGQGREMDMPCTVSRLCVRPAPGTFPCGHCSKCNKSECVLSAYFALSIINIIPLKSHNSVKQMLVIPNVAGEKLQHREGE